MNEAVFPLLGPLLVFAVVLPLSAFVSRALLATLRRFDSAPGVHSYRSARYAILVSSSAVPLSWFFSASLHQAENGRSALVCVAEHAPDAFCAEAAFFSLALCVLAGTFAVPGLVREQFMIRASITHASLAVRARIAQIVGSRAALSALRERVVVSDAARIPIATLGIFSPRVVVRTAFAEALDDEALAGALHHELEHFRGRDPLRYFIVWWALAVNPVGRWLLRAEYARWLLGREAHCDRRAVLSGASAVALAHALVVAARPARPAALSPALASGHIEAIKLRLSLLLAYADRPPRPCSHAPNRWLLLGFFLLVLALPHRAGTEPLDTVHVASERAASLLLGN